MKLEYMKKLGRVSHIPDAWELTTVGEVCKVRNDLRKPISVEERATIQGSYPYYGPTGVLDYIDEYLVNGEFALIGEDGDHFLKPQDKPQTSLVNGKFNANNHVHLIQSSKQCLAKWFYLYFHNRDITNFLSRQGANRYKLNKETLLRLPILVPPIEEQEAVYEVNINWVDAIKNTERLIQKKQIQYEHIVHELIHRIECHQHVELKQLAEPVNTRNSAGEKNVLTSSAKHGLISQLEYYNKSVSAENVSGYYRLQKGEFAYNRSSATGYPFGAIKRLDRYDSGVLSTLYLCFRLTDIQLVDSNYLADLFESGVLNRQLRGICQAGARSHGLLNITKADFFSLKVPLPPIETQREIASKLGLARKEIELLECLKEKYKEQKRGLMQKLLTGEWHVNADEEAA